MKTYGLPIAILLLVMISAVQAQDATGNDAVPPGAPAGGQVPGEDNKKEGTGGLPFAESAEALLQFVTTPEMEAAIQNGLKTLVELQDELGSIAYRTSDNSKVAGTSLAGLALLASGSTPNSGPYCKHIQKAIDWILGIQDPNSGYIFQKDDGSRIHGHGYATLFLCQAYGQNNDSVKLRKALSHAVKCLEAGQTKEGGWGYQPEENTWDEGSTTICVIQALRAAQDAGIAVKNETIAQAIGYIEKIAEPKNIKVEDGSLQQAYTFMYALSIGASSESYALAAAAVSCINNIGVYSKHARWNAKDIGAILDGGMRWLMYNWKAIISMPRVSIQIVTFTTPTILPARQHGSMRMFRISSITFRKCVIFSWRSRNAVAGACGTIAVMAGAALLL